MSPNTHHQHTPDPLRIVQFHRAVAIVLLRSFSAAPALTQTVLCLFKVSPIIGSNGVGAAPEASTTGKEVEEDEGPVTEEAMTPPPFSEGRAGSRSGVKTA